MKDSGAKFEEVSQAMDSSKKETDDGRKLAEAFTDPKFRDAIRDKFVAHNKAQTGTSSRIKRVLLMAEPPSVDGHEITDKGYVNQRATLERRKALVDKLYTGDPAIIEIP